MCFHPVSFLICSAHPKMFGGARTVLILINTLTHTVPTNPDGVVSISISTHVPSPTLFSSYLVVYRMQSTLHAKSPKHLAALHAWCK